MDLTASIFDLVDRIVQASTPEEAWKAYLDESSSFGLTHGYLGSLPRDIPSDIHIIDSVLPRGYLAGYTANKLRTGDMATARARADASPFVWQLSDWTNGKLTPAQLCWRDHCSMYGITGGLCIPDFAPGGPYLLALLGQAAIMSAHDRMALCFAGHELVVRLRDILGPMAAPAWLSLREKQCLEWVAAGKTDWEIGVILSLSEKTVNVYINRAKSKLGVKSRAQAVLKASEAGLIAA